MLGLAEVAKQRQTMTTDNSPKIKPAPPKVDATEPLPQAVIEDRMRLVNPELAKEVLDFARAQVQAEAARHGILNTKATSLVAAAGVSITVLFSVAGMVMSSRLVMPWELLAMFAAAGVFGLSSVVLGVLALLVTGGFAQVSEHAVFDKDALEFADEPTGCDDLTELKDKYAYGVASYRQHMTVHLWAVYAQEHKQLDGKATQVRWGQRCFIAFVGLILACEMTLFGVISSQNKDAREAAQACPAAPSGSQRGEVRRQGLAASESSAATGAPAAPTAAASR
jgi:hypothetical protein